MKAEDSVKYIKHNSLSSSFIIIKRRLSPWWDIKNNTIPKVLYFTTKQIIVLKERKRLKGFTKERKGKERIYMANLNITKIREQISMLLGMGKSMNIEYVGNGIYQEFLIKKISY